MAKGSLLIDWLAKQNAKVRTHDIITIIIFSLRVNYCTFVWKICTLLVVLVTRNKDNILQYYRKQKNNHVDVDFTIDVNGCHWKSTMEHKEPNWQSSFQIVEIIGVIWIIGKSPMEHSLVVNYCGSHLFLIVFLP